MPLRTRIASFAAVAVTPLSLGLVTDDHVVRPGDTVSAIATAYHTTVDAIVSANRLRHGGHLIFVGDTLRIPAAHGRPHRQRHHHRAHRQSGHRPDARRVRWHTVKPGDTVTELAVRYHAWTGELVAANHLGPSAAITVGQRLRIPVVLAALPHHTADPRRQRDPQGRPRGHRLPNPSHATVRGVIERIAARYDVDPQLALAVSWQEAGWQQDHISSAKAIGAMQVLPSTGRWIETIIGRQLHLRHSVRHNATAGVVLLRELREAAHQRRAIAGYYQGLASVREHGMYHETRHYVRNVLAIKHRFEHGDYPY